MYEVDEAFVPSPSKVPPKNIGMTGILTPSTNRSKLRVSQNLLKKSQNLNTSLDVKTSNLLEEPEKNIEQRRVSHTDIDNKYSSSPMIFKTAHIVNKAKNSFLQNIVLNRSQGITTKIFVNNSADIKPSRLLLDKDPTPKSRAKHNLFKITTNKRDSMQFVKSNKASPDPDIPRIKKKHSGANDTSLNIGGRHKHSPTRKYREKTLKAYKKLQAMARMNPTVHMDKHGTRLGEINQAYPKRMSPPRRRVKELNLQQHVPSAFLKQHRQKLHQRVITSKHHRKAVNSLGLNGKPKFINLDETLPEKPFSLADILKMHNQKKTSGEPSTQRYSPQINQPVPQNLAKKGSTQNPRVIVKGLSGNEHNQFFVKKTEFQHVIHQENSGKKRKVTKKVYTDFNGKMVDCVITSKDLARDLNQEEQWLRVKKMELAMHRDQLQKEFMMISGQGIKDLARDLNQEEQWLRVKKMELAMHRDQLQKEFMMISGQGIKDSKNPVMRLNNGRLFRNTKSQKSIARDNLTKYIPRGTHHLQNENNNQTNRKEYPNSRQRIGSSGKKRSTGNISARGRRVNNHTHNVTPFNGEEGHLNKKKLREYRKMRSASRNGGREQQELNQTDIPHQQSSKGPGPFRRAKKLKSAVADEKYIEINTKRIRLPTAKQFRNGKPPRAQKGAKKKGKDKPEWDELAMYSDNNMAYIRRPVTYERLMIDNRRKNREKKLILEAQHQKLAEDFNIQGRHKKMNAGGYTSYGGLGGGS